MGPNRHTGREPLTASDASSFNRVTLRCPSCGASEQTAAEELGDEPVIVCRNCGDTWPAGILRAKSARSESGSASQYPMILSHGRMLDAVRRPLVSYSEPADEVWAARLQADAPAPVTAPKRYGTAVAAAVCAAFLVVFIAGRETAVSKIPDLAGLYKAVGMAVNLQGLAIEGVEADRSADGASAVVRGFVVNISGRARPIPPMKIAFLKPGQVVAGQSEFEPPTRIVEAGGAAAFEFEVADFPPSATEVTVRFRAPADGGSMKLALSGEQ